MSERFVAKTDDGGMTWQEVPLVTNPAVREFGIAFLNETTGWVGAMPHGFFTSDGGKNWMKADMGNAVNKIRIIPEGKKTFGFAIGTKFGGSRSRSKEVNANGSRLSLLRAPVSPWLEDNAAPKA